MQVSDWSQRAERMRTIISITRSLLDKAQPLLTQEPKLSISYNQTFQQSIKSKCFTIDLTEPIFAMRSTLQSEQQLHQRKEEKYKQIVKEREEDRLRERRIVESRMQAYNRRESRKQSIIDKREALLAEKERFVREAKAKKQILESTQWSSLPPMRVNRRYLGVAISPDGSKLYAVGGYSSSEYLNSVEYYDFKMRSWGLLPSMISRRCGLGVAISPDGRFLYAVGGYDGPHYSNYLNTVERFDFEKKEWGMMPSMRNRRAHMGVVLSSDGKKLYAAGGNFTKRYDTVEVLVIGAPSWTPLPPMREERSGLGTVITPDNTRLIAIGGYNGGNLDSVEEYNLKTNRHRLRTRKWSPCFTDDRPLFWSPMSSMTRPRRYLGAVMAPSGSRIYVVGGCETSDTAEFLDMEENTWHNLPRLCSKRRGLGIAISSDGHRLFAVGGNSTGDAECLLLN
eukprot:1394007-Amorphochlora_amoeboformis.AAC.1